MLGIQFFDAKANDDLNYFNIGVWNNDKLFVKIYNQNPTYYLDEPTVTENTSLFSMVEFTVMINGNVADLYYKDVNGNIQYIGTCDKGYDIKRVAFRSAVHGGTWEVSNIKILDGELGQTKYDEFSAPVTVSTGENATATSPSRARLFKKTVINITPASGYILDTLTINDTPWTYSIENGVYVVEFINDNINNTSFTIEVTTKQAVIVSATATVKTKKVYTDAVAIADGTSVVIFGSNYNATTTVVDGKVQFSTIPTGSYVLMVDGYKSYSFNVGKDGFDEEVILYYIPFNDFRLADITASNEGKVDFTGWSEREYLYFKDTDIVYVEFNLTENLTREASASADYSGTSIRIGDTLSWGTHYLGPNKSGTGSSLWRVRWGVATWRAFSISASLQSMLTSQTGLKIGFAIDGSVAYGLVQDEQGNMQVIAKQVNANGNWGNINAIASSAGNAQIKNLYYANTVPQNIMNLISNFKG
jgi:hypothetical protein